MFCNCNPETCDIVLRRENEIREALMSKPCDGFVHKHSCGAECKTYRTVNFGSQIQHYCGKIRIDKRALKWIKIVGCYSYEDKNGDNK
jgi:hypothetical protein